MILLDTNIVSEVMRQRPEPLVVAWLNRQQSRHLFLSAITIAEIEYGLQIMPMGQRRARMTHQFTQFITHGFQQRILTFDQAAAQTYGKLIAHRRALGRPMTMADGQIAAIAATHRFSLATRNEKDFLDCDLTLINPFVH
ncbi:MAG: type II toxin-antitoxin system VapC family toxin [Wenzhouxiangellaceae bacterium]